MKAIYIHRITLIQSQIVFATDKAVVTTEQLRLILGEHDLSGLSREDQAELRKFVMDFSLDYENLQTDLAYLF